MPEDKKIANTRRDAIRKIFHSAGFMGMGGMLWGSFVDESKSAALVLRPPAAIDEKDFLKTCIKCGTCVNNCPYQTLKLAKANADAPIGTPYFLPRETPCYMCPDIPCVPECPTGALDEKKVTSIKKENNKQSLDINKAKMGLAVIHKETCIAFWGVMCDACYRACPLMDKAITIEYERNERTGEHAFLKPVVNGDECTGCGICEHACVIEKSAIFVLPVDKATGRVGEHYIKSWEANDEQRLQQIKQEERKQEEEAVPAEEYLNDWESLLEE